MSYTIKTYEEGFIDKQVELGTKMTEDWIGYTMSSADSLKNSYSQENFDPETRLYAFKENEMVGFLTSYIAEVDGEKEAHFRLPIMLPNHEEAANKLIEKSFEVLQKKDVKKIVTAFKEDWGAHRDYAERYNFEENTDQRTVFALAKVSELIVPSIASEYKIEELDLEKHGEALVKIFRDAFGLSQDAAENNLNLIQSFDENNIISHSAIFQNDEIIGRLLLYKPSAEADFAYLGNIYAPGKNEELFYDLFMAHVVEKSNEKGVKMINKTVLGDNLKKSNYEKYGFKFDNVINSYTKYLNIVVRNQ